jgi:uncharacterized repeat protein (TIGR03803 family)
MPQSPSSTVAKAVSVLLAVLMFAGGALAAPGIKVLHAFGSGNDGGGLWASLAFDSEGNLYGTTSGGGAHDDGTVFELTPEPDGTWTESILHSFSFGDPAGGGPMSAPFLDVAGNLYATAVGGGVHNGGTVFELAHDTWAETILYSFCSKPKCSDGGAPEGGLVHDHEGSFYGTAGYPFKLSPKSNGWKETALHRFTCRNHDGCGAVGGVVLNAAGNVYGVTAEGGTGDCSPPGCGLVYELQPMSGGKWKEIVLHDFGSFRTDGVKPPFGALSVDSSGNVYGTTDGGGKYRDQCSCGTVYKLAPGANGKWKETILHSFRQGSGGAAPSAGVVMDKAGNLYGVTGAGGDPNCDCGVIYKLAPGKNGQWEYTVLHRFQGYDGEAPGANLIFDGKGNLYGTTTTGGTYGAGVAFEFTP